MMHRILAAVGNRDALRALAAGVAIAWGLKVLSEIVEQRHEQIALLDAEIAKRAETLHAETADTEDVNE